MGTVNRVILLGNLGKDPELRFMPNGDPVCNVNIATNRKYKGKDGNQVDETEWHRLTLYRKQAELVAQYCKKGNQLYVEGRIQSRKWNDKEGLEHTAYEIIVDTMTLMGSPGGGGDRGSYAASAPRSNSGGGTPAPPDSGDSGGYEEDAPF